MQPGTFLSRRTSRGTRRSSPVNENSIPRRLASAPRARVNSSISDVSRQDGGLTRARVSQSSSSFCFAGLKLLSRGPVGTPRLTNCLPFVVVVTGERKRDQAGSAACAIHAHTIKRAALKAPSLPVWGVVRYKPTWSLVRWPGIGLPSEIHTRSAHRLSDECTRGDSALRALSVTATYQVPAVHRYPHIQVAAAKCGSICGTVIGTHVQLAKNGRNAPLTRYILTGRKLR